MKRLADIARHNLLLKAVSLAVALVVWAWRSGEANPLVELKVPFVAVNARSLKKGLLLVTKLPPVTVTVKGPRRTLDRLSATHGLQPFVDCSGIEEPTWTSLKVALEVPDGVERRGIDPPEVLGEFDTFESQVKPIRADVGNSQPQAGYVYDAPKVERDRAEVRGPRKLVSRVTYLQATVDVSGLKADATGAVKLVPMDAAKARVSGVECLPVTAAVRVRIRPAAGTKVLPVTVPQVGKPAAGWRVVVHCEPAQVSVTGTAEGLARQGGGVSTRPLEVNEKQESFDVRLPLVTAPGVVARPDAVTVKVTLERTRKHGM